MSDKLDDYESLLRELSLNVDESLQERIAQVLERVESFIPSEVTVYTDRYYRMPPQTSNLYHLLEASHRGTWERAERIRKPLTAKTA